MSHDMKVSIAQKQKEGRPLFTDEKKLKAACKALGIPEPERRMASFDNEQKECWLVSFPKRDSDKSHWRRPVRICVETGEDRFDNYSAYTERHVDVREGRRRVGEEGRWGDIERLWELDDAYWQQVNPEVAKQFRETAAKVGDSVTSCQVFNNGLKIVMEIGEPTPSAVPLV